MNLTNPTAKDIEAIKLLMQPVISLNAPVKVGEFGEEVEEMGSFIEDPGPGPEELYLQKERREQLEKYMAKYLSPKHLEVIRLRYGFEDGHYRTLSSVAKELGITRERVRQIELTAIRRLRGKFMSKGIREEDI